MNRSLLPVSQCHDIKEGFLGLRRGRFRVMRERLFLCPHGSKTHLLLMLENNCKYYAQMFGGVINAAYLCPIN